MRMPGELLLSVALMAGTAAVYAALAAGGLPASSGLVGHALGITGFLLMAGGTFGYAWRKRRSGPGSLQVWLQLHVVTGLVGPWLILLHSAFAFRGIAGITFFTLIIIVGSGLVGRYVFTRVPKPFALPAAALRPAVTPALAVEGGGMAFAQQALVAQRQLREDRVKTLVQRRRRLAGWWLLHVPLALAMFALALLHVAAALYYITLLR